jgi:hypothetical protein
VTNIEIADQNFVAGQIVSDDEARASRVSDPVQHADTVLEDWSQIGVEMNGHHGLIFKRFIRRSSSTDDKASHAQD